MKTFAQLTEAEETARGQKLVELLALKKSTQTDSQNRRFDPPRYETAWGTKTALGLFRSIAAVMEGEL